MTQEEMTRHNEALAISKIKQAFRQHGFYEAMRLCAEYMGVDAKEAFERTKVLTAGEDERG